MLKPPSPHENHRSATDSSSCLDTGNPGGEQQRVRSKQQNFNSTHVRKITSYHSNDEYFCSDQWKLVGTSMCFSFFFFFSFFLFSTQNQVSQIIIRMGRVIYQSKVLSVVFQTKLKKFQKIFHDCREKTGLIFCIFAKF